MSTKNTNTGNDEQPDVPECYIVIRFAAPGATLMNVTQQGVYPSQMIVAGDYLIQEGHRIMELIRQKNEQEARTNEIVKPSPKIIVPK